jgi:hypothetical protein
MLKAKPIRTVAGATASPTPGSSAIAGPTLANTNAKAGAQSTRAAKVGFTIHQ